MKIYPQPCWHRDNEKADSAAKSALDLPRATVGVPYTDLKYIINQYIFSTWQDDWNGAVVNKLYSVEPVPGDWQSSYRRCRKDEAVLCRARIGHTHLIHSYILKKDPPPQCEHCQCILTVRHILVECNNFGLEKKYIFGTRDVVESFRFHPTLILLFLKQIEFYSSPHFGGVQSSRTDTQGMIYLVDVVWWNHLNSILN